MTEGEIFVVVHLSPWFTYPHSPLRLYISGDRCSAGVSGGAAALLLSVLRIVIELRSIQ